MQKNKIYMLFGLILFTLIGGCSFFNKPTPEYKSVYSRFVDQITISKSLKELGENVGFENKLSLNIDSRFMTGDVNFLFTGKQQILSGDYKKMISKLIFDAKLHVPFGNVTENINGSGDMSIQFFSGDLSFRINNFGISSSDQKLMMLGAFMNNLFGQWISTNSMINFSDYIKLSNVYFSSNLVDVITGLKQQNIFENPGVKKVGVDFFYEIQLNKENLLNYLIENDVIAKNSVFERFIDELKFKGYFKTSDGKDVSLILSGTKVSDMFSIGAEFGSKNGKLEIVPTNNLNSKLILKYTKSNGKIDFDLSLNESGKQVAGINGFFRLEYNNGGYVLSSEFTLNSDSNSIDMKLLHSVFPSDRFDIEVPDKTILLEELLDNLGIKGMNYEQIGTGDISQ